MQSSPRISAWRRCCQRLVGDGFGAAWRPCRAARLTRAISTPVRPVRVNAQRCEGPRDGACSNPSLRQAGVTHVAAVQPDSCRRRWPWQWPSLAWKLDDRAALYTVPIKAVPQECGAPGRVRPAPPAQSGGVVGPSSPFVPVCRMPRSGRLVQSL